MARNPTQQRRSRQGEVEAGHLNGCESEQFVIATLIKCGLFNVVPNITRLEVYCRHFKMESFGVDGRVFVFLKLFTIESLKSLVKKNQALSNMETDLLIVDNPSSSYLEP